MKKRASIKKRILRTGIVVFVLVNGLAYFHAYTFTHFTPSDVTKTLNPGKLNLLEKFKTMIFGIGNPRPTDYKLPIHKYKSVLIKSNKLLEIWDIAIPQAKGTVILFHGYGASKSSLLDKADIFLKLGYNTVLVDFMGSGGSEGYQTTLGYDEAIEVKDVFNYVKNNGKNNIYLFGTSMGAVAILKALNDYHLQPLGIIIECPFGSLYQTTVSRFKQMNVPSIPMAAMLTFWGGLQNEFWAFNYKPSEYAKNITTPTLLLYGEQDKNVSVQEINEIYHNLKGQKTLHMYKLAGHNDYLAKYRQQWIHDVSFFMSPATTEKE